MIAALDTNILVSWAMAEAEAHDRTIRFIHGQVGEHGWRLGLVPLVLWEFLHVVTDTRRFESPFTMPDASDWVRRLWDAQEVERLDPPALIVHRSVELIAKYRLGRKRILDTVLAATLEAAGVTTLITLDAGDFAVFPFLDAIEPS